MGAEVIQVIRTDLLTCGSGKNKNDPVRRVEQYWTLNGELLWERDRWLEEQRGMEE